MTASSVDNYASFHHRICHAPHVFSRRTASGSVYKKIAMSRRCAVPGCGQTTCLNNTLPKDPDVRGKWMQFIFCGHPSHGRVNMGDMCQDCTQIFELLKDLVSNQDFQAELTATLEQVCDKLPPKVTKMCHTEVEKMLPLAITFISSIMNPSDICTYLGLCGGRDSGKMKDLLLNHMAKTVPMVTMKMEGSIQCSVCTYVVSALGYLFPKERTQSVITILLESLCREFPPLIQPQCNKLVEKYVQLLVDMLLNNTSPNFICTLLQLCEIRERPINAPPALSDCDSCLTLAVLTRMRLGSNATERQAASFLDTICQLHPGAMPKCDAYVQHHGNQLRVLLSKPQGPLDICMVTS